MLLFSLIVSALLLLLVNWWARVTRQKDNAFVGIMGAFLVAPVFLFCLLPLVALQALLIGISGIVWRTTRRTPSSYLIASCGATLVAYGFGCIMALSAERDYARLRALYPYESMEGRAPAPRVASNDVGFPRGTAERLSHLEDGFSQSYGIRNYQLELLHEHAVSLFVNSPGFGNMRMIRPTEAGLASYLRRDPVPLQPGSRFRSVWSPGEMTPVSADDEAPLNLMLDDSVLNFVNPRGFGFIKDRKHVAGFESHRFSQVPRPANRQTVQTIELVSLLCHAEPEVYVSSHLPSMDRLNAMPTRPLDRFEHFGLNALRRGEDIVTDRVKEGVRMLGAVRSSNQCITCHACNRGDLLGAFSYNLSSGEP